MYKSLHSRDARGHSPVPEREARRPGDGVQEPSRSPTFLPPQAANKNFDMTLGESEDLWHAT